MTNNSEHFGKIIIPVGVFPERHELETANFFAERGKDIEFILPHFVKGVCNPDIKMDGLIWEIKVPIGKSKRTIENNYRRAQKQSENVIFDIRKIALDEKVVVAKIKQQFSLRSGKIKKIKIVTKNNKVLDIHR
jgi:hypothetical protein